MRTPEGEQHIARRMLNVRRDFLRGLADKLGLRLVDDGESGAPTTLSPRTLFNYIYAVLSCPTYRSRYAKFLSKSFPRVPITRDRDRFLLLAELGRQLVELHVMDGAGPDTCTFPVAGDNCVDKVLFKAPDKCQLTRTGAETKDGLGRVYVNARQYFDGISETVWDLYVGGFQVAQKWLKDRKGRVLTFDDLQHYRTVIAALNETTRLQAEIDAVIPGWPLE